MQRMTLDEFLKSAPFVLEEFATAVREEQEQDATFNATLDVDEWYDEVAAWMRIVDFSTQLAARDALGGAATGDDDGSSDKP